MTKAGVLSPQLWSEHWRLWWLFADSAMGTEVQTGLPRSSRRPWWAARPFGCVLLWVLRPWGTWAQPASHGELSVAQALVRAAALSPSS